MYNRRLAFEHCMLVVYLGAAPTLWLAWSDSDHINYAMSKRIFKLTAGFKSFNPVLR